jgi:flagellar hook-length control protein FliK
MNDMRLPGLGFVSNEMQNAGNADAPRDAAQDFDAVMARFSNQRANAPAPDQRTDAGSKATQKTGRLQGKTSAPTNASESTHTSGKPVTSTAAQEGDADSTQPAAETGATDPAALLAAVTGAGQLAGSNPEPAAVADAEIAPEADKNGKTAGMVPSGGALEVLAGLANAARLGGEKIPADLSTNAANEENDVTPVGSSPSPKGRAPVATRDTLRFEAPLKRTFEPVLADVAQRFSPVANAVAQATTHATSVPGAENASQAIAAAVAANSGTAIYSIAHSSVAAPVSAPGFANELAQRVVLFAGQKVQRAEIAVTPPDLGPIGVAIEVRGQEATLAFVSSSYATRAAIEDALPRLREMFSAQGLQLAGTHVGSEPRRDPYRPTHSEKSVAGESKRESPAAVSSVPGAATRRRLNLIDIEV